MHANREREREAQAFMEATSHTQRPSWWWSKGGKGEERGKTSKSKNEGQTNIRAVNKRGRLKLQFLFMAGEEEGEQKEKKKMAAAWRKKH